MMSPAFEELMAIRAGSSVDNVQISGTDPVYSSRFKIAETGAAILAAVGVATSDIWRLKTGRQQSIDVDVRHAGAALNSAAHLAQKQDDGNWRLLGNSKAANVAYSITRPWPTRDGRWFLPHFGITHLKEKVMGILECTDDPASVSAAVARWDGLELEETIAAAGACGGMIRSFEEWCDHPHGAGLLSRPVVEIQKIADSDPEPFPTDGPPLAGIRALDLTRILAGPVAARSLAEQGADVLMVSARHIPQIKPFVMDLSHGKRSCFLDLNSPDDAERLRQLVQGADVFSQGYRPGVLAARGFGPEELAQLRPGLIYTSITCFGDEGPLNQRAGWEQVAQSMVGICHEHGGDRPDLLPVPACDYMTGYLGAFGTLLALQRRAVEGGSYHVNVSLCQSGMFLYRQGRTEFLGDELDLATDEIAELTAISETSYGTIRHLAPIIRYSQTNPAYANVTPALGGDAPEWRSA